MFPLVTASPGEENSLPNKGTHLKVRQEMCFYSAEFLAAIKLTALQLTEGKFLRFPNICLKNVDKYMSCHWRASSGSNYQTNLLFKKSGVLSNYIRHFYVKTSQIPVRPGCGCPALPKLDSQVMIQETSLISAQLLTQIHIVILSFKVGLWNWQHPTQETLSEFAPA